MVTPLPSDVTAPADKGRNPNTPDDLPRIVPRRHIGRWLTAVAALLVFAMAVNSVVRNDAFQWAVVGRYFTTAAVVDGLLRAPRCNGSIRASTAGTRPGSLASAAGAAHPSLYRRIACELVHRDRSGGSRPSPRHRARPLALMRLSHGQISV
ncbi:hypothetical protein [Streptomyces vastus]|uniref:Uncharacterized protein n=1 Tax=Streptomyces vastus TaxID=285451 RepID=A0ABN3RS36_9ACTN